MAKKLGMADFHGWRICWDHRLWSGMLHIPVKKSDDSFFSMIILFWVFDFVFFGCSLNRVTLFRAMGFVIGLHLSFSLSFANAFYWSLPRAWIVVRHSTEDLPMMSLECNLRSLLLSSSNGLPRLSIILTGGFTCATKSLLIGLCLLLYLVFVKSWFFLTIVDSNSVMKRTSSGPTTVQRKRASGSCVKPIIHPSSLMGHIFVHGHDRWQ